MYGRAYAAWMRASLDAWAISLDAATVIALRLAKLAMGADPGGREARLMVAEKMQAGLELQMKLVTGQLGSSMQEVSRSAVQHYGRRIAANRRRLSRYYWLTCSADISRPPA